MKFAKFVGTKDAIGVSHGIQQVNQITKEVIEGQTAEVNLALVTWAQDVSAALDIGFVLTRVPRLPVFVN